MARRPNFSYRRWPMADAESLKRAYGAIGALRARGVSRISVGAVAKLARLARSTFYLKDDKDWEKVRRVIGGEPSEEVGLVQVELMVESEEEQRLAAALKRVEAVEARLLQMEGVGASTYKKLVDSVQHYFALSHESPKRAEKQKRLLTDLGAANQRASKLMRELDDLRLVNSAASGRVSALARKNTITLSPGASQGDLFSEFLDQFAKITSDSIDASVIAEVYVLCGLPRSGKTSWINNHKPNLGGQIVYIDGTNHTKEVRKFLVDRLKKKISTNIHCVRISSSLDICKSRMRQQWRGVDLLVNEKMLTRIHEEYEEIGFDERFDLIVLV